MQTYGPEFKAKTMADDFEAKRKDNQVKENERKIEQLEKQVIELQAKENQSAEKIKALKEEIERLEKENHSLKEKIEQLEYDHDQRIKAFELTEDQLCIGQLCTSLQKNICEIVLGRYFDEKWDHNVKEMDQHIENLIEDEDESDAARERWKELKRYIKWNPYWISVMSSLRKKRNEAAHPPLTEEKIEDAIINLKKEELVNKTEIKAMNKLKEQWKLTNYKLSQRQTITEPEEHLQKIEEPYLPVTSNERLAKIQRNNTHASSGGEKIFYSFLFSPKTPGN